MKQLYLAKIWTLSLGFLLIFPGFVWGNPISNGFSSERMASISISQAEILAKLKKANVIYLGETHDQIADHQAQLQIIQSLYQNNPKIAIGLEMFQRPSQGVIDQYIAGKITEEQLIEQTEYNQRWGFPWEYYAEILRFAKENQLPTLALNTPTEITRKVARQGLESLTETEKRYIPPFEEIKTDNQNYRQMLLEIYQQFHHGAQGNSNAFENFFLAQVLWDETMAEKVAEFIDENPDYMVIVLVGQGHIVYNYGIPSRVERRLNWAEFKQYSVLFQSPEEDPISPHEKIADFIWKHEE